MEHRLQIFKENVLTTARNMAFIHFVLLHIQAMIFFSLKLVLKIDFTN